MAYSFHVNVKGPTKHLQHDMKHFGIFETGFRFLRFWGTEGTAVVLVDGTSCNPNRSAPGGAGSKAFRKGSLKADSRARFFLAS